MKLEHAKINYAVAVAHGNYVTANYWIKKIKRFGRKTGKGINGKYNLASSRITSK